MVRFCPIKPHPTVATSHAVSAIAIACPEVGKHVLIENPGGRNLAEISTTRKAADTAGRSQKNGYNHRLHPAIMKARQIVDRGELGPLMFIRGRYGHDGRPGYEEEWRFERSISGAGELIDKGSQTD